MSSPRRAAQMALFVVCLMALFSLTLLGALGSSTKTDNAPKVQRTNSTPTSNTVEDDEGHTVHVVAVK